MKLLIWCEKSRRSEEFLTKKSWNCDGNDDMKGGNAKLSLFEIVGFTKKLIKKKNINVYSSYFYFSSISYMVSFL